jgi:hypothetical protein
MGLSKEEIERRPVQAAFPVLDGKLSEGRACKYEFAGRHPPRPSKVSAFQKQKTRHRLRFQPRAMAGLPSMAGVVKSKHSGL